MIYSYQLISHDFTVFKAIALSFTRCLIAASHDGLQCFPHAKAKGRKNKGNEKGRFLSVKTDLDSYILKKNSLL